MIFEKKKTFKYKSVSLFLFITFVHSSLRLLSYKQIDQIQPTCCPEGKANSNDTWTAGSNPRVCWVIRPASHGVQRQRRTIPWGCFYTTLGTLLLLRDSLFFCSVAVLHVSIRPVFTDCVDYSTWNIITVVDYSTPYHKTPWMLWIIYHIVVLSYWYVIKLFIMDCTLYYNNYNVTRTNLFKIRKKSNNAHIYEQQRQHGTCLLIVCVVFIWHFIRFSQSKEGKGRSRLHVYSTFKRNERLLFIGCGSSSDASAPLRAPALLQGFGLCPGNPPLRKRL